MSENAQKPLPDLDDDELLCLVFEEWLSEGFGAADPGLRERVANLAIASGSDPEWIEWALRNC